MGKKDNVQIINEDAVTALTKLESESVDLIFVDPPYNIGKKYENMIDKWESSEEYFNWSKIWIDELFRVLRKEGTMYIMTSTQEMPRFDLYISSKYNVVSRIVWHYDSSGVQAKKFFGSLYEPILMCTKTKNTKYIFNAQDILVEAKTGSKRKLIDYRKNPPQPYNTKKVPGNVWNFNRVRYRMKEYVDHPTQKPEKLLERIILVSSNVGDVVLDPFAGSFTTCAVAARLGRKSIGIELSEEYCKIGYERIKGVKDED